MENKINNSLAQDKVIILYILDKINRDITESDLFKLIFPASGINYFDYKQILTDLLESKLIRSYTKDEETENNKIIKLTDEGKTSLDLTIDVLPGLLKLKTDTVLKTEMKNIVTEDSVITEFYPEGNDSYTVKCKIRENNKTIFEIRVFANSNNEAKIISDNWKNNACTIYPKILEILTTK